MNDNGKQTETWTFTESQLLSIGAAQAEVERRINVAFQELALAKGFRALDCRATVTPIAGKLALQVERPG